MANGSVVVRTKPTKDFNKDNGVNTSGDFVEALNQVVLQLLERAQERAKANGRKTVRPEDL